MTSATTEQRRRWGQVKQDGRKAAYNTRLTDALMVQFQIAREYGSTRGIRIDMPDGLWDRTIQNRKQTTKLNRLIRLVNTGELGINFVDNDLEIMAPATATDDEITSYRSLGIAPLLIIGVGIVVVTGVATWIKYISDENKELQRHWEKSIKVCESRYCEDPSSESCAGWKQVKQNESWTQQSGIIAGVKRKLTALGGYLKKPIGNIATILLLVAAGLFAYRMSR